MCKQTARRGVHLHPAKRNLDKKTLWEMKRVENIEEPQDSGRSIVLKNDYEVDLSQSSYEEWLKDNNLAGASSDKENPNSNFVIEINTTNSEICKKEEVLDVTVCSTLSSMSELDKTQEGFNKSEVRKKQMKQSVVIHLITHLMTVVTLRRAVFFHIPNRILLNIMQILQHQ